MTARLPMIFMVAVLMVSGPMTALAVDLLGWFRESPSCSTDPQHGHNTSIDFTEGMKATQIFHDPRTAALADAAARNASREMKAILKQGADPNARGEKGLTLLGWTLRRDSRDAFETLLDAGADATVPEHDLSRTPDADSGRTVVHYAAMNDDPIYLEMLLAHHVSPDVHTPEGVTPLVAAIMSDCDKHFHRLIAAHANVNTADTLGYTPLQDAVLSNSFQRALDLLNAGADPTARNKLGKTFQAYLHLTPERVLSKQGREVLAQIDGWLIAHHIPLEPRPDQHPASSR
jgi:uncharacterized protein